MTSVEVRSYSLGYVYDATAHTLTVDTPPDMQVGDVLIAFLIGQAAWAASETGYTKANVPPIYYEDFNGDLAPSISDCWWADSDDDVTFPGWEGGGPGSHYYQYAAQIPGQYSLPIAIWCALARVVTGFEAASYTFKILGTPPSDSSHSYAVQLICLTPYAKFATNRLLPNHTHAQDDLFTRNDGANTQFTNVPAIAGLMHEDGSSAPAMSAEDLWLTLLMYQGRTSWGTAAFAKNDRVAATRGTYWKKSDGEPSGWQGTGFDDSGWTLTYPNPFAVDTPLEAASFLDTPADIISGHGVYYRSTFPVIPSAVTTGTLRLTLHNGGEGIWINGHLINGAFDRDLNTVEFLGSYLSTSATNVIAMSLQNGYDPYEGSFSIHWELTLAAETVVDSMIGFTYESGAVGSPEPMVDLINQVVTVPATNEYTCRRQISWGHFATSAGTPLVHSIDVPTGAPRRTSAASPHFGYYSFGVATGIRFITASPSGPGGPRVWAAVIG